MRILPLLGCLLTLDPAVGQTACYATVNGRPMSADECMTAYQIYGALPHGHYFADSQGNWVKNDLSESGNVYLDAQRDAGGGSSGGGGHWSDGGLTSTPFGSVGGGMYLDNETGSSYGP